MSTDAAPLLTHADSPRALALRASPNHGARRAGAVPYVLLLHYTGMPDGASAIDWLCDTRSQVSCHYVVEEDGGVLQLVAEERRAWHAGSSFWAGETDINSVSIGIEIVNPGHDGGLPPFPDRQIEAVIGLCQDILTRHPIRPARVLGHSDVAPGRKRDPGERFPWKRLAEEGVGVWLPPPPTPHDRPTVTLDDRGEAVSGLQRSLAAYGYGIDVTGVYDAATAIVLRSFQMHFRQARVDGIADAETQAILVNLLAACGVTQA